MYRPEKKQKKGSPPAWLVEIMRTEKEERAAEDKLYQDREAAWEEKQKAENQTFMSDLKQLLFGSSGA